MRIVLLGLLISIVVTGAGADEMLIIPQPRDMQLDKEFLSITGEVVIRQLFSPDERPLVLASTQLSQLLTLPQPDGSRTRISLASLESGGRQAQNLCRRFNLTCPDHEEGYVLKVTPQEIVIIGRDNRGLFYGIMTLKQMIQTKEDSFLVQCGVIKDYPSLAFRGIHFFTGKNALEEQKNLLDFMATHKMNSAIIQLDYMEFDRFPELRYEPFAQSKEDIRELIEYARERYIKLIPFASIISHTRWVFRTGHFLELAEDPTDPRSFTITNPGIYQFIYQIIDEVVELFEPDVLHIGLDEIDAFEEYPSREESLKYSLTELLDIFLPKMHAYLRQKNIQTVMIWGDMLLDESEGSCASFAPSIRESRARRAILKNLPHLYGAPEFIICDWHYTPFAEEEFNSLKVFHKLDLPTIVSTWLHPENIRNFTRRGITEGSLGLLQTTWAGFNFNMADNLREYKQFSAYLLAADYSWSGREERHCELPYHYRTEFWKRWYSPDMTRAVWIEAGELKPQRHLPLLEESLQATILPVVESFKYRGQQECSHQLQFRVRNVFSEPLDLQIKLLEHFEWQAQQTLPPGGQSDLYTVHLNVPCAWIQPQFAIPVQFTFNSPGILTLDVERTLSPGPLWHATFVSQPMKIDADLSDWQGIEPYVFEDARHVLLKPNWTPEDLQAKMYLAYDTENFYFAFDVQDDVHFNNQKGRFLWQGDGVQLVFDFLYDRHPGYNEDDMQIGFFLTDDGEVHRHVWIPSKEDGIGKAARTEAAIERRGQKTVYEIRIPRDIMMDPAPMIGFSFSVNDNDGEGLNGHIVGSAGVRGERNSSFFGTLILQ